MSPYIELFLLLASTLPPMARAHEVRCYAPDGHTLADNLTYVPCNKLGIEQDGVESSCCRLDGKADERDLCATSGLCLNSGVLFRGYCTDKNWDSPACINVCTNSSKNGSSNETVEITPCTDGMYCCGHNNLACCGTDEAFEIPMQSSVAASRVTETSLVTQFVTPSAYKDATIGLSAVLGASVLGATCAIVWLTRQNRSLRNRPTQLDQPGREAADYGFEEQYPPEQPRPDGQDGPGQSPEMANTSSSPLRSPFFGFANKSASSPIVSETEQGNTFSELDNTEKRVESRIPGFESSPGAVSVLSPHPSGQAGGGAQEEK